MLEDIRIKRNSDLPYSRSFFDALYIPNPKSDLITARIAKSYQFRMLMSPVKIIVHFVIQTERFVVSTF